MDERTKIIGNGNKIINIGATGAFKEGEPNAVICPQCGEWTGRYNLICGHPARNCHFEVREFFDDQEHQAYMLALKEQQADALKKSANVGIVGVLFLIAGVLTDVVGVSLFGVFIIVLSLLLLKQAESFR